MKTLIILVTALSALSSCATTEKVHTHYTRPPRSHYHYFKSDKPKTGMYKVTSLEGNEATCKALNKPRVTLYKPIKVSDTTKVGDIIFVEVKDAIPVTVKN